jgi:hypothetical protein
MKELTTTIKVKFPLKGFKKPKFPSSYIPNKSLGAPAIFSIADPAALK